MLLQQLFDPGTWTYTYILADTDAGEAIIIDPVAEQVDRDLKFLEEHNLELLYVLDTHVHADHVTGSGELRNRTGAKTVVAKVAGVPCVDVPAEQGDVLKFGSYSIEVRETPGHTDGCLSFVGEDADKTYVFTGDALLIGGCGRTDFQQGNSRTLYKSIHEQVFTLPDDTVVYPGHDYKGRTHSTVGKEKAENDRLKTSVTEDEFVDIMNNLKLAAPRLLDVAVPANLACGQVAQNAASMAAPNLTAIELMEHQQLSDYRIIDVREPSEFNGELGHLEGADLVPLKELPEAAKLWPTEEKLLVVCRSGGRSRNACDFLTANGFKDVSNLDGGMIAWNRVSAGGAA